MNACSPVFLSSTEKAAMHCLSTFPYFDFFCFFQFFFCYRLFFRASNFCFLESTSNPYYTLWAPKNPHAQYANSGDLAQFLNFPFTGECISVRTAICWHLRVHKCKTKWQEFPFTYQAMLQAEYTGAITTELVAGWRKMA